MLTERLELRPPVERDRSRFVALFQDDEFMVFSGGVCTVDAAHARFGGMLSEAADRPFAKQPVIVRSTGTIVGYSGAAWFELEGEQRLELSFRGEMLAMIDPSNRPSQNVAAKLGFTFWKDATVDDYLVGLYRRVFP